jgi:hypothetical protein
MITLLHSLDDYMVLTLKIFKNIYRKKYDHETINKFKYIQMWHISSYGHNSRSVVNIKIYKYRANQVDLKIV